MVGCFWHRSPRVQTGLCVYHGIGLDFHQYFRGNESRYLNHRGRRANFAEYFAVGFADLLPIGDVHHIHPRAHHILEPGARLVQRGRDVLQRLHCLRVRIADPHDRSVRPCSCRSRNMYVLPYTYGAGVSDYGFPLSATRNFHALHWLSFSCSAMNSWTKTADIAVSRTDLEREITVSRSAAYACADVGN